ncbi:MAG: hypothetical protein KDC54_21475, partial [Lewinella sp.]|nr:hypothetical protein [Lewinella sp.]
MNFRHTAGYGLWLAALMLLAGCRDFDPQTSTIHLIGDSTMAEKRDDRRPETGWGEMLGNYFQEGIRIADHALNGRSTKSFRDEGHWQKVLDELRPGDYLFIQFGHNDAKEDTARFSSPADYAVN